MSLLKINEMNQKKNFLKIPHKFQIVTFDFEICNPLKFLNEITIKHKQTIESNNIEITSKNPKKCEEKNNNIEERKDSEFDLDEYKGKMNSLIDQILETSNVHLIIRNFKGLWINKLKIVSKAFFLPSNHIYLK